MRLLTEMKIRNIRSLGRVGGAAKKLRLLKKSRNILILMESKRHLQQTVRPT